MRPNITGINNCFGCGVCSASCGRNIISIELNKDGFYQPRITNPDRCTNCGICFDVCAFSHDERALSSDNISIKTWAAWSNNVDVRKKCSSGGIGFEIGRQLIQRGYYAVGCRYDINKERAEHYIATTVEDFCDSIGSKYIQSYTVDAFKQINRNGQKYLVTGTPCQIDSFRRMIRTFRCDENFILMDFFCHCVPSMWAWKSYLKMLEPNIGKVTYVSWRNKFTGWHDSWTMNIRGDLGEITSWRTKGDLFYKLFLGDNCMGPQCQKQCKYKMMKSSADIRIGDLWGKKYQDNNEGVSALISFTKKGEEIITGLKDVTLVNQDAEIITEKQLKENTQLKKLSWLVLWYLKKGFPLEHTGFKIILLIQRVAQKLSKLL